MPPHAFHWRALFPPVSFVFEFRPVPGVYRTPVMREFCVQCGVRAVMSYYLLSDASPKFYVMGRNPNQGRGREGEDVRERCR